MAKLKSIQGARQSTNGRAVCAINKLEMVSALVNLLTQVDESQPVYKLRR
jgi:hypothetical protein